MKKFISVILALSMLMSISFTANAEEKVFDAYSGKITALQNDAIFGKDGPYNVAGNRVQLSYGGGVVMYQNVDFGDNGVKSAVVDLAADAGNMTVLKIYAYPAGTAPFIKNNTFDYDTYKVERGFILQKDISDQEADCIGMINIDGTNNKFSGWNEGNNAFEIPITAGNKLTGKYDIFIGADYGDFYGISFKEYEKTAYNHFAWNDYNYLSNENVVNPQGKKLAFSTRASVMVFRDVDFGNVGAKSLKLDIAPGYDVNSNDGCNVNLYLVKKGEVFDENWNITDTYQISGQQIQFKENSNPLGTANWADFRAESGKEWEEGTYTMEIPDGCKYRGLYDVIIGISYGDFFGMTFEPLSHDTVSAYAELSADKAISLGGTSFNTQKHIKMTGGNNMVLYKNVDFGETGANKIKIFAGSDSAVVNMNMYLVKPEDDNYIDEIGRLNGYSIIGNSLKNDDLSANVGGTMWYDFTANTNWEKGEKVIDFIAANNTGAAPVTGVYDVYIGLTYGDFYGIQFLESNPEDGTLSVNGTEFSGKNYYGKTAYPGANVSTGVLGQWGNDWDHGANKRYAMWYADFGNEAQLRTVDVYYGLTSEYANSYATIYADEIDEDNIIARGVMTYQDGMDWGASEKYMTLPVKKALTGVHKIYLCVENSPYATTPVGDITKLVFNNAENYTKIDSVYGNAQHSSLIFNKESDNKVMHAVALYKDGNLVDVDVNIITPTDGVNSSDLFVSTENLDAGYTVKSFVWNFDELSPIQ